jgi:hypothetical protein
MEFRNNKVFSTTVGPLVVTRLVNIVNHMERDLRGAGHDRVSMPRSSLSVSVLAYLVIPVQVRRIHYR